MMSQSSTLVTTPRKLPSITFRYFEIKLGVKVDFVYANEVNERKNKNKTKPNKNENKKNTSFAPKSEKLSNDVPAQYLDG